MALMAGEGVPAPRLMIVGEQPGDTGGRAGGLHRPRRTGTATHRLKAARIDPERAWLTNAVKHFKFEDRGTGKRRLHRTPPRIEIDVCRW